MTKLLDGKWLSTQYHSSLKAAADSLFEKHGRRPGLGVILVGDNPASMAYVRNKSKIAKNKCGFETEDIKLPATASFEDVANAIDSFNKSAVIDGILMQLPLPDGLDSNKLLDLIDPRKDADGLHPFNQGVLIRGDDTFKPCTPRGVMALIDLAMSEIEIGTEIDPARDLVPADLSGKHAVVIGRSILVGKPVASLLLERNATVSIVHSRTKDIEKVCQSADILVAAVGRPHLVTADWVKNQAIVIDVGINRIEDGSLTGDVDFESVSKIASAITPVPKGVGPMTIAMLMDNTLKAYQMKIGN